MTVMIIFFKLVAAMIAINCFTCLVLLYMLKRKNDALDAMTKDERAEYHRSLELKSKLREDALKDASDAFFKTELGRFFLWLEENNGGRDEF